ncbi:hypothetical protein SKAU_G00430280 [Synaphobranchus kaupii]|uniref:Uncharacterized protein n=1 Tax=Synaphobranchus kaupii TaxID=118154 RepID=A0A9Q1I841_SYNKA|nr:hypothetical protein SKAU_G00430280 [Synaphobranchus kaupii]
MEPCTDAQGEPDTVLHHVEILDQPVTSALMSGDNTQPLTPGKMSARHGKDSLQVPSRDPPSSPTLSTGVGYSHGFDRGKEEALQLKEDTSHSISKSKVGPATPYPRAR